MLLRTRERSPGYTRRKGRRNEQEETVQTPGNTWEWQGAACTYCHNMTITVIAGRVSVSGFPSDLRTALDILHEAAKAIINNYVSNLLKMRLSQEEAPKQREYMGARPN